MADGQTEPEAVAPAAGDVEQEDLDDGDEAEGDADADGTERAPASFERRVNTSLKRARRAMHEAELTGEHKVRFHLEEANSLALLAIASALRAGRQE